MRWNRVGLSFVHPRRKFGVLPGFPYAPNHLEHPLRPRDLAARGALDRSLQGIRASIPTPSSILHRGAVQPRLNAIRPTFQVHSNCVLPFVISVRPKASDIVLFFNQQSKHVDGLGDVCSYALMNIEKDGDEKLAGITRSTTEDLERNASPRHFHVSTYGQRKQMNRAKIELSLLNFATQNPDWNPPASGQLFIQRVKEMVFLRPRVLHI